MFMAHACNHEIWKIIVQGQPGQIVHKNSTSNKSWHTSVIPATYEADFRRITVAWQKVHNTPYLQKKKSWAGSVLLSSQVREIEVWASLGKKQDPIYKSRKVWRSTNWVNHLLSKCKALSSSASCSIMSLERIS
jgi:hypothetical protein